MTNYGVVLEADELEMLVDRLVAADAPFGLDIESGYTGEKSTQGLALLAHHPRWLMVGFSISNGEWARYIPIAHDVGQNIDDVRRTAMLLWRLVHTGRAVAHNMPFEQHGIARFFRETIPDLLKSLKGLYARGYFPIFSDSMVEVVLTGKFRLKGLKPATLSAFDHKMTNFDDLWDDDDPEKKSKAKRFNSRNASDIRVIEYACEDAYWCLMLHNLNYGVLADTLIYRVEMDLMPGIVEMEHEVMVLDWEHLERRRDELTVFVDRMNEDVQKVLATRLGLGPGGLSINLNSPMQLQKVLFNPAPEGLGFTPTIRSERTGAPSTGKEALGVIARADKDVKHLLNYKKAKKALGAYFERYCGPIHYMENGTVIPSHNQLGTITGRLSVDGVSYQQLPKKMEYSLMLEDATFSVNFRDMVISPKHFRQIGFDFSQVELRVIAGVSGETALIESFRRGEDVHKRTAALMLGKDIKDITKDERAIGKTLNFAIVYGAGPARIAAMLSTPERPIDKGKAKMMLDQYLAAFPRMSAWIEQVRAEGWANGHVFTPFGRKVPIWEFEDHRRVQYRADREKDPEAREKLRAQERMKKQEGERLCSNAPIQGGGADIMKMVMIRVRKAIADAGLSEKIQPFMTVHDALEMYVHESLTTQEVINLLAPAVGIDESDFPEIMAGWPPLVADWHEGANQGTRLYEIDLEGMEVTGYSQEDDNKIVHRYASFEDALAGVEIQSDEVEVAEDDEIPEEVSSPIVLSLPANVEAEWVKKVMNAIADPTSPEPLEFRWGQASVVMAHADLQKAQMVPSMVAGARLYIDEEVSA